MRACPLLCIQVLFLLGHLFLCSRTASNLMEAATPCAAAIGNVLSEAVYLPPNDAPKAPVKPRLEYFHIPKSGGTMLESLGGKNGLSWGACNFVNNVPSEWLPKPPWIHCPPLAKNHTYPHRGGYSYWHVPIYVLPKIVPGFDPYDSSVVVATPKRFFTVIRNPYDRMISIYYYFNGPQAYKNDPKHLNKYILSEVRDKACIHAPECYRNKYICYGTFKCGTQYDYIYKYDSGEQVIDHILHFETLQQDFAGLASEYSLDFQVPAKAKKSSKVKSLTAADLSDEVIQFINTKFRKDFELGRGYEMRLPKHNVTSVTTSQKRRGGQRKEKVKKPAVIQEQQQKQKNVKSKEWLEKKKQNKVEMVKRTALTAKRKQVVGNSGNGVRIAYPIGYGKRTKKRAQE